jgi:hypothetical protein
MDFKTQLKNAETELLELERQKLEIERQMQGWIQIIEGLRVLSENSSTHAIDVMVTTPTPPPLSMPDKILAVLAEVKAPIGATQIRDQLVANHDVDVSDKNLLINIHTTLKRLIPDQIEEVLLEDGSKLYRFITPMQRAIKEGVFVGRARTLEQNKGMKAVGTKWVARGNKWTDGRTKK